MKRCRNNERGFSLIELIIVIAIMAILAAILFPQFIKYVNSAKSVTCLTTRDNIRELMEVEMADTGETDKQKVYDAVIVQHDAKCPSDGTYSLVLDGAGGYEIRCSQHNDVVQSLGVEATRNAVMDILFQSLTFDNHTISNLDSGALAVSDKCQSAAAVREMKKNGLDLEAMGAKSWAYRPDDEGMFYWTKEDISTKNIGDTVTVMRYNKQTNTYTVWKSQIISNTTDTGKDESGKPIEYNSLGGFSGVKESTSLSKEQQTYDNAMKLYNELVAKD